MGEVLIDKNTGEAKLILDTSFYGYGAILAAGKDYLKSCWVFIDGDLNDKILVTLKPKSEEVSLDYVGYEFANYVLGLMQNAIF
ncbi:MAG: hypothetical protein V1859_01380 [archaeon]